MRLGDRGEQVKALQRRLTEWGFPAGDDGIFGVKTEAAVKAFQKGLGLYVDGIVGLKTQSALDQSVIKVTHFKKEEFRCRCGRYCNGYIDAKDQYGGIDYSLLIMLERLRKAAGNIPCNITSGYRCIRHNRNVGGARNSQHTYGRAADIYFNGLSVAQVNIITDSLNPYGGVGLGGNTITHVDTRGYRARWTY